MLQLSTNILSKEFFALANPMNAPIKRKIFFQFLNNENNSKDIDVSVVEKGNKNKQGQKLEKNEVAQSKEHDDDHKAGNATTLKRSARIQKVEVSLETHLINASIMLEHKGPK